MHVATSNISLVALFAVILAPLFAFAHANSEPKSHPNPVEPTLEKRAANDAANPLPIDRTRVKRDREMLISGFQYGKKSFNKRDEEYNPDQPLPTSLLPPCHYDGIHKICLDPCINDEGVCRKPGEHKMSWEM